jgi:hypothetical protein
MKTSTLAGSFLASLALIAAPLNGQQVSANILVRSGPLAGHVIVGDEHSSYHSSAIVHRPRPARRIVLVKRYAPRVLVVERFRHRHGRHWKRMGYRPIVVYYIDGRYYDRLDGRHPRVREVVVYERGGRYYRLDDRYDDRRDD